ncbi:NADPH-dependent FMN reductase, partial [Rhizobium ruizarguesonis]
WGNVVKASADYFRSLRETVNDEYNRSIPGGLKNAIDWASSPYGTNSFRRKPSAVIGTSPGAIGTEVAQQNLRSVLSFCNSPQMNAPEAY